jgi:Omp85 superfamily domain
VLATSIALVPCSVCFGDDGTLDLLPATLNLSSQPSGEPIPAQPDAPQQPQQTQPAPEETPPSTRDLFFSREDGYLDVSGFLSSKTGFLPVAMPITEPAVGYGLSLGLAYFHTEPKAYPTAPGERARISWPSMTVAVGAGTENGTWALGLAHLGIWDQGRIRYLGAIGYANLNLEWFGKGEALGGRSISYTNNVFFIIQNIRFKLGESDFFLGPQFRFLSSDASLTAAESGIPDAQIQSQTSGVGAQLSYDSTDHPFSPSRGIRADLSVNQQATWLGGDFNYTKVQSYVLGYVPLQDNAILGLRLNGDFATDQAPFYDLPGVQIRGLARAKYVDNAAIYGEAELRYDFSKRWSGVAFVGAGKVGSALDEFFDSKTHFAGGVGFRYLIAERYGLRMGVDLAYGDDEVTVYISVGTGWMRP